MKNSLLLLTNYFPYWKGEEYLEAELPHLVAAFDEVCVVPLMTTRDMTQTRTIPEGVRVVNPVAGLSMVPRVTQAARHLGSRRVDPVSMRGDLKDVVRHPVHAAFDTYFESRSLGALDAVLEHEAELRPDEGSRLTVYSYWFYLTARVGVALRERWADRAESVRVVSRGHGYDVNVAASAVNYLPRREFLLKHVDALHPVSNTTAEYFRREYPRWGHKVSARYLGSPEHPYGHSAVQAPPHLVTVSTIRPLKRLDLVADAVRILREEFEDLTWTHLGSGAGQHTRELREHVAAALPESTVTMTGHVDNAALHEWYRTSRPTVFVNASTSEGIPVSIMEAMSYGLPIVATDVGGTKELFTPEMFDGLLPAELDAETLAARVRDLITAPTEDYARWSEASRRTWASTWNADENFRDFAAMLRA